MMNKNFIVPVACLSITTFGVGLVLYGNNIINRNKCIICSSEPPCYVYSRCNPNTLEGKFLSYLFMKK